MGWVTAIAFAAGPFLYLNIGGRGLFLYIAALFVLALAMKILSNNGRLIFSVPTVFWPYLLLVLWQIVCFAWTKQNRAAHFYEFIKIVAFVILLCMNTYSYKEKKVIHSVQTVVAVYLVVTMLLGGQGSEQGRYAFSMFGVEQDPNYMCFFLLMPFYWCLHTTMNFKTEKKGDVILSVIALVILATGFLATGSRGALLGLFVGAAVYLFAYKKMSGKRLLTLFLLAVVAVFVLLQIMHFLPEEISSRFRLEAIFSSEGSGRYKIWARYLEMIFDDVFHALFGHGTFSCLGMTATHNYVLEMLYENGIVGLLLALPFYIKMIRRYIKTQSWASLAAASGALALSMSLSVSSMLQFWLCIASSMVLSNSQGTEPQAETTTVGESNENRTALYMHR